MASLLSSCDMPRLSAAYDRVAPVHEQRIEELARVERRLARARSRAEAEPGGRHQERLEAAEARLADYDERLTHTLGSIEQIVASMAEQMCHGASDDVEQYPSPVF